MGQETPGLKKRQRKGGEALYWCASPEAVKAGFEPKTVNLSRHRDAPLLLAAACKRLDAEQRGWLSGKLRTRDDYDGTFASLLRRYETHPQSTFAKLKANSRAAYLSYVRMLTEAIGKRRVTAVSGLDIKAWHDKWKAPDQPGGREKIAAASFAANVLKAALAFGVIDGNRPGCKDLHDALSLARFPKPRPRNVAPTAEQIAAARAAARGMGHPRLALAYALQFETTLRLWDVVGQWLPMDEPYLSTITARGRKWIGPAWSDIDSELILRHRPTKTADTTEVVVSFDLKECPMVMQELALIPPEARTGPLILNGDLPYWSFQTRIIWRAVAKKAGMTGIWNRDIRAGGITQARRSGANLDDVSKAAGHSGKTITARVYDRDTLEHHRRVRRAIAGTSPGTPGNDTE